MKADIKKLEKSQLEITFELTAKEFNKYVDRALEHLKRHTKMDGFRPGTVPKDLVEKQVGSENLLMEAGDLAVKEAYTKAVNENHLEPIGNPDVQIKKIAKGSEFLFVAKISVLPEVSLPDYKEIASSIKGQDVLVEEKEIEDTLTYLQKSRATFTDTNAPAQKKDYVKIEYQNEKIQEGKPIKDIFILGEAGFLPDLEDQIIGMKAGDEKEFMAKFPDNAPNNMGGKESKFKVKMIVVQKMELPEINDEFAKGLGMFDNLVALKSNLMEGITAEKKEAEKHRKRGEILSKIASKVSFDLPEKMVEYEHERLFMDMKNQVVQQFKLSFEEYLKQVKKTEDNVKRELRVEAEKRIKNFLVLRQIGKAENIEPTKEEIEEEMNKFIKNYTKEESDKIDINQLKEYTKDAIFNEKVFEKLEAFSSGVS